MNEIILKEREFWIPSDIHEYVDKRFNWDSTSDRMIKFINTTL